MGNKRGVHLILDLYGCDLRELPDTEDGVEKLKHRISDLLKRHSLTEVGNVYHYFGPQALTATICLAESHLTFHTWPEDGYVSVDLFVCNRRNERTREAHDLTDLLAHDLFKSSDVRRLVVPR